MLDPPKEAVAVFQDASFAPGEELEVRQDGQSLQRAGFLKKRVARPVEKLQRLHDELNLANPARTQLHIASDIFVADNVALDAPFDSRDLLEHVRRRTLRKNKRLMLAEKFVSELATPGNTSRLDQ